MDFCLKRYKEICEALQHLNVVTVENYLRGNAVSPFVVLRHDVDREVGNALAMAKLEHRYGISSTYYFRYPRTFNAAFISKINSLGHEIGYHYEVLDKAKGDYAKAIEIFRRELDYFRRIAPVTTVCMHGNPLTPWDGRSLWKYHDFKAFGLLGEAFISVRDAPVYLTDTGRNWNGNHNIKDSISAGVKNISIRDTKHLIQLLEETKSENIYLNCHPERWGPGIWGWARALVRDNCFNLVKTLATPVFWLRNRK